VGTALWVALFATVGVLGAGAADGTGLLPAAVGVSLLGPAPVAGRLLRRRARPA
jgi:hypothetical protein